MSSGIISLWFRDLSVGTAPAADEWPSGRWTQATADTTMLPPDTLELVKTLTPPQIFYWNSYGIPLTGVLGSAFAGPQTVIMPSPPPLAASEMRMVLTFGDVGQTYDYCEWVLEHPSLTNPVIFIPNFGVIYRVTDWPPPYKPYFKFLGGNPVGDDGKFVVANMKLKAPQNKPNMVPQSFIGISKEGYLTICLQTNTKADYKGYAFQIDHMTEITATQTIHVTGGWSRIPGYWDGFQFWYEDISNKIMGVQPESFVLGGTNSGEFPIPPRVNDNTWHHLLLSFDISGEVRQKHAAEPFPISGGFVPPVTSTTCKAWYALDDKNYTDASLQHAIKFPNGISSPQLDGMGKNGIFSFGPNASLSRAQLDLGPNDIVPQNVWVRGFWGNPRDGLPRFNSAAGVFKAGLAPVFSEGDFNFLVYSSDLWVLFGGPYPGPWFGTIDPPRPTNPDPEKDLDVPTYSCSGFEIPTNGNIIGIPSSEYHLKHNSGVEMAELQIWANKTLDTSDEGLRRLFIDEHGKAVPPSVAAEKLGKPDILLHGTNNWKKGKNTGTTGVDSKGVLVPGGQFNPVAKIEKFLPDPQLKK